MSKRDFPDLAEARRRYPRGTNARYVIGKCRCDACREAARVYNRLLKTPWEVTRESGKWVVRNGKTGEVRHRLAAQSLARKRADELNEEHAATRPEALVSTEPVRKHIAWLRAHGVGMITIAPNSGVAYSVIERIFSGDISRTRRATAQEILSVQPDVVRGGMHVRVDDTLILIERLVKAGYRRGWIATQLGAKHPALMIGRTPWVSVRKARAVHALYLQCAKRNRALPMIDPAFSAGIVEPAMRRRQRYDPPELTNDTATCPHGSQARYRKGCRCKRCSKAHADFQAADSSLARVRYAVRRDGSQWVVRDVVEERPVFHSADRVEALSVRDAFNSEDPRTRSRVLVSCEPIRARLHLLNAKGHSDTDIAKASGVPSQVVSSIRAGRVSQTQRRHADPLLSLDDEAVPRSNRVFIDAKVPHEMLERLEAAGVDAAWLAIVLGCSEVSLHERRKQMRLTRARAIMALYASLRERIERVRLIEDRLCNVAGAQESAS